MNEFNGTDRDYEAARGSKTTEVMSSRMPRLLRGLLDRESDSGDFWTVSLQGDKMEGIKSAGYDTTSIPCAYPAGPVRASGEERTLARQPQICCSADGPRSRRGAHIPARTF